MTKKTLAELLRRQVIDDAPSDIEHEELGTLNTSLPIVLVRGTGETTTVDAGGWLRLFEQAHPSSHEEALGVASAMAANPPCNEGTHSYGLRDLIQKEPKNLIALEAHEHAGSVVQRKSPHLSASADGGADILGFPRREQLSDDPFRSLSPRDIERAGVDPSRPGDPVNDWPESLKIGLAAASDVGDGIDDVIQTDLVIVSGNLTLPVWQSSATVPVMYVQHAHLPEGASAIRLGGYHFLIADDGEKPLSPIVGCRLRLLESLASTDNESGRRTIEAEIETKA